MGACPRQGGADVSADLVKRSCNAKVHVEGDEVFHYSWDIAPSVDQGVDQVKRKPSKPRQGWNDAEVSVDSQAFRAKDEDGGRDRHEKGELPLGNF
jgi:hypothetical protein